jgi:hypothetical protein
VDNKVIICPKCNGKMEQGFLPDFGYGAVSLGSWHRGLPKRSILTGIKVIRSYKIPLAAFRCSLCGFVELYSNNEYLAT